MSTFFRNRLPLFELSLILVLAAMGWALWEQKGISRLQTQYETRVNDELKAKEKTFQDHMEQLWLMAWKQPFLTQSNALNTLLEMEAARKLREAYLSLAVKVDTDATEIQQALARYVAQTNSQDEDLYKRKSQELHDWVQAHELRLESERLVARSQELTTNGPKSVSVDLRTLCQEIQSGLSSYTNKADRICTLARNLPAFKPADLQGDLAVAEEQNRRIKALAAQAQRDAMAVETRPLPSPEPPEEFKHELAKAQNEVLLATPLTTESDYSERLQTISYAMLAAILALSFILVTSIYRKVVVERLELKLYESATESKLAHLGQLAAWLAHEIKQPLTAINAWLWTLQKAIPTGTPEHLGTTAIRKEISRLDQIVKDFLRFTQPSVPKLAPVAAEPLLREIRDLLGPDLARQGIQLQLDGVAKARFSADPQQLKQVLINLITNAADSIEHDGTITLRARKDQARLKGRNSDVIVIEVEDTGQGIPPEVQQRLFDPFFSTKEEGTGLGLPIAANIIDKHGGLLEFKTDPGKGTIFAILLPLLKDAA